MAPFTALGVTARRRLLDDHLGDLLRRTRSRPDGCRAERASRRHRCGSRVGADRATPEAACATSPGPSVTGFQSVKSPASSTVSVWGAWTTISRPAATAGPIRKGADGRDVVARSSREALSPQMEASRESSG